MLLNLDEISAGVRKTDLVYLKDMEKRRDDTNVVKVVPEKRTHAYLILERSIFHPKGGGQPSDKGTIRSQNCELELKKALFYKGVVVHWGRILSGKPAIGPVTCDLDWPFRYLVMRRHTAAHLLDHCLSTVTSSRVETTDSWLDQPCYVGYAGNSPNPQVQQQVEDLANSMISRGGKVGIQFLTPEEGKALLQDAPNFERLPDLEEVRTVTIAGCKPIPCGGTHVDDIGKLREIKITRAEQMPESKFRLHFAVEN